MSIIACPKCRRQYQVKGDPTGKNVKCANCQHVFTVNVTPATAQPATAQPATAQPTATANAGPTTSQPGLFPDTIPAGPDPLANHIIQDPGFADVDVDEIRQNREADQRKHNKLADAYSSSSSVAKMEEEEFEKKKNKVPNEGYLSSDTLFGFDGRINRKKFWLSSLFYGMISLAILCSVMIIGLVIMFIMDIKTRNIMEELGVAIPLFIITAIIGVVNTWVSLALHIKRYHDLGHAGTRILIGLIPVVGAIWVFVECGFFPGEPKKNAFGPDPLKQLAKQSRHP